MKVAACWPHDHSWRLFQNTDFFVLARTANGTALCATRCSVSESNEFCHHNPLCCFSTSAYCCSLFCYQLSPETFGYTLIFRSEFFSHHSVYPL